MGAGPLRGRRCWHHLAQELGDRAALLPDGFDLQAAWDEEWQSNVLAAALDRVKRKIDPQRYQIFDCAVIKQWPAAKVAAELHVSVAQVYLVKHRVSAIVKKEVAAVEKRF